MLTRIKCSSGCRICRARLLDYRFRLTPQPCQSAGMRAGFVFALASVWEPVRVLFLLPHQWGEHFQSQTAGISG